MRRGPTSARVKVGTAFASPGTSLVECEVMTTQPAASSVMAEQRTIGEIEHGSREYWATVELRDMVLRKPLGLQFQDEELRAEKDSRHIACWCGSRLVGCLVLRPLEDGDVQMRQVAVASEWQGKGIGRAMVAYSEELARGLGYRRMILHARDIAVPFYAKLGYATTGDPFVEVTIPHWTMEKCLGGVEAPEPPRG